MKTIIWPMYANGTEIVGMQLLSASVANGFVSMFVYSII